jgi:hypothetical protein
MSHNKDEFKSHGIIYECILQTNTNQMNSCFRINLLSIMNKNNNNGQILNNKQSYGSII